MSTDDDDRTVIRPQATLAMPTTVPASRAGAAAAAPPPDDEDSHALPMGTMLGEFELTEKIGEGGFSIVYLARDHTLGRQIALKEYMPSSIAARKGQTMVSPRSERHRDTFEAGLKSFINEARLLAQYDHASLVKVHRFWEANGTAYMVMPFYEGVTVRDTVRAMGQAPDEAWLMRMLAPLTEALAVIHADQCYHRDIAPDNVILLARSNRPLLLDFGAARRVIGDMTQALTVILKPGYAPVEQYAEVPDMKQGPWTDVYALGATIYWCITGKTPPPAVGRMLSDNYKPLAECAAGRYSDAFLQAVDRALAVHPDHRTPSIEAFRQDLGLVDADGQPLFGEDAFRTQTPGMRTVNLPPRTAAPAPAVGEARATAAVAGRTVRPEGAGSPGSGAGARATAPAQPAASSSSRAPLWLAGGVVAAVLAGAGWWWSQRPAGEGQPTASTSATVGAEPSASSAVGPAQGANPDATTPTQGATAAAQGGPSSQAGGGAAPSGGPGPQAAGGAEPGAADSVSGQAQAAYPSTDGQAATGIAGTTTGTGTGTGTTGSSGAAGTGTAGTPAETPTAARTAPQPDPNGASTRTAARERARETAARPNARTRERADGDAAETSRPTASRAANQAECASLLQRVSLGETSPELMARLRQLRCG